MVDVHGVGVCVCGGDFGPGCDVAWIAGSIDSSKCLVGKSRGGKWIFF